VLLDLGLPDIDGLQLIGQIRKLGPVPIVVLSSRGDEAAKVAALDSGADDYVTKPFGADELLARLRAACAIACRNRAPNERSPATISASTWCAGW